MSDEFPPQEGTAPAEPTAVSRNELGQFASSAQPAQNAQPQYDVPVDEAVSFYKAFHSPETREQAMERTMRQYGYLPQGVPLTQATQVIQAYAQEAGNPLYAGMPQNQYPPQQGYAQPYAPEPPFLGYDQAGQPVYGQPQGYAPQPDPGIPVDQLRQGWQYDFQQGMQQARQEIRQEILNDIAMQQAHGAVQSTIGEIAQRDGLDDAQRSFLMQVAGGVMQQSQAPLSPETARQVVQDTYDRMRGFRQAEVGRQVAGLQGAPMTQTNPGVPSGTPDQGVRGLAAATADAIAKLEAEGLG